MLVLSRKHGEEVVIGRDVHITVVAVQGNRVKLGITAPPEIDIRRAELPERTDSVSQFATQGDSQHLELAAIGP